MRIPELFGRGKPVFSFEFFLPKAAGDMGAFKATVLELKKLEPSFVTLTYGAGGSARERTIETAGALKNEIGIETAAHLTCVAHTRAEIDAILERVRGFGIENIVALRGDAPKDGPTAPLDLRDFGYASDLVRHIRKLDHFAMAVAGYPEKHPEALSVGADVERLKEKVDAGAHWIITQLFFDNEDYFAFRDRARAAGIGCPIVPGIMPVTNFAQLRRFTSMCGAKIPLEMGHTLHPIQADPKAVVEYGIEHAVRQCRALLDAGAPGIHFYTLNRSASTATILKLLRKHS